MRSYDELQYAAIPEASAASALRRQAWPPRPPTSPAATRDRSRPKLDVVRDIYVGTFVARIGDGRLDEIDRSLRLPAGAPEAAQAERGPARNTAIVSLSPWALIKS